ncbi:MAG: two pore domain potassium channel family protein [Notoacmeibacter sp.]|nr:two pore domain potassium channel family protein [Notoacmeibacter sp.]
MVSFVLTVWRLMRAIFHSWKDPLFRAAFVLVSVTVFSGTLFYRHAEGWSWIDSAYFSITTISTVGLGDLAPKTDAGKIFTMVYIVVGIGLFVTLITRLAATLVERRAGPDETK